MGREDGAVTLQWSRRVGKFNFRAGCSREWRDGGDVEVSKPVGPIRLAGLGSHDGLLASEHYGFLCSY